MACLKCNSDWVTAMGKNCASCPHCCKQTRCKERKAGRWVDNLVARICVWCRKSFTPESVHKRTTKVCSPQCKKQHRKHWAKGHRQKYSKEGATQRQLHGKPMPPCKRCGKPVRCRRRDYCGRECYQADKKEGVIGWDMTGQQLGDIRKRRVQGLPMPSQVMYAAIQDAMNRHAKGVAQLWKSLDAWRPCLHCGGQLPEHAQDFTMFCSIPCSANHEWDCACFKCGKLFCKRGVQGRNKALCRQCRRVAKRLSKHRGISSRARKHGVVREKYSRKEILDRDCWECQLCGVRLLRKWKYKKRTLRPHPDNATLDHIVPMACGGADAEWNIQACCFRCNARKGARQKGQLRLKM